jgi:hypothetical protein
MADKRRFLMTDDTSGRFRSARSCGEADSFIAQMIDARPL